MGYMVFIDGASKGNPGVAGIGIAIYNDSLLVEEISKNIGRRTNNEAEYIACKTALLRLSEMGVSSPKIFTDSKLLAEQLNGNYKVKSENLKELNIFCKEMMSKLLAEIVWIRREDNSLADSLANKGVLGLGSNSESKEPLRDLNSGYEIYTWSFFGKINCLKIQLNSQKEVYMHIGLLSGEKWTWEKIKLSEIEIGDILRLIRLGVGNLSFFHSFADKKTQIWIRFDEKGMNVKISSFSKNLSLGEVEVLRVYLEESLRRVLF